MYKNFKEYWELKKGIYEELGVSKDAAYNIWCDCTNLVVQELSEEVRKHLK